jgi:hypothetical protein
VCDWNAADDATKWCRQGAQLLTTLLDALHGSTRDCPVNSLCGILDGLNGALASDGGSAEQAGLTGNLGAEHGEGDVGGLGGLMREFGR